MKIQGPEPNRLLYQVSARPSPRGPAGMPDQAATPGDLVRLTGAAPAFPPVGKMLAVGGMVVGCVAGAVTLGPLGLFITAAAEALAFAGGLLMSRASQEKLEESNRELLHRATTDPLTGLRNRGAIFEILEEELGRCKKQRCSLSVILCDIDHFKKINDTYGHPCGDAVLQEVARRLAMSVRAVDSPGRYGGEEMLVVLPGASSDFAAQVAERIRCEIAGSPFLTAWGKIRVTMSLGVAGTDSTGRELFPELIQAADQALYRAKQGGRNRVVQSGGRQADGWQITG